MSEERDIKELLKKQQKKDVKQVTVVKKTKTVTSKESRPSSSIPVIVTKPVQIEKRGQEEETLRDQLQAIINQTYNEDKAYQSFVREEKDSIIQQYPDAPDIEMLLEQAWNDLSDEDKIPYALLSIAGRDKKTWGISGFIHKILLLPVPLRTNLITRYLNQDSVGYDKFYELWSKEKAISKQLTEFKEAESMEPIDKSEIQKIIEELTIKASEYAKRQDIEIGDAKSYYSIIERVTSDLDEQHKLHQQFAQDYIELAIVLGNPNAAKLSLGELLVFISTEKRKLLQNIPASVVRNITDMSRDKRIKEATNQGIKDAKDMNDMILLIRLLQNQVEKKRQSREVPLEDLIQEARELNIPNPDSYTRQELLGKLVRLRYKRNQTELLAEHPEDRTYWINKLTRLSGKSTRDFENYSIPELQEQLKELEESMDFEKEIQRESILDSLIALSGKSKDFYRGYSMDELTNELEKETEKRMKTLQTTKDLMNTKTCVEEFRRYKWIDGKVTGIWITGAPVVIQEYATKAYIIVEKRGKFYKPNARYYQLQCNRFTQERVQKGDSLVCYDSNHHPVTFKVGYSLGSVQTEAYRNRLSPIVLEMNEFGKVNLGPKMRNEQFLLQDEELFNREKQVIAEQKLSITRKKQELLSKPMNDKSIGIARKWLSKELLRVAPHIKDYEMNSVYIGTVMDSISSTMKTNMDLFKTVADIIVFLKLQKSELFKARIRGEYYLPDILNHLSAQDKLPEIYDPLNGVSDRTIELFTSHIESSTNRIIQLMVDQMFSKDPSAKKEFGPQTLPFQERVEYDAKVCVNSDVIISPENAVYYRDPEDNQIYCLDVERLAKQFQQGDFTNVYTGKMFSKDFIHRYTVTYHDDKDGQLYTFPFEQLYNRFKMGNIVNPQTNRNFDRSFVLAITKGNTWIQSAHLRSQQFKRMERRLAFCKNPDDILNEPVENILYYKDPQDDSIYCFIIGKLRKIIMENRINPYTGRPLSEEFVNRFLKTFSQLDLKGIREPEFRQIYEEPTVPVEPSPVQLTEEKIDDIALIIPDLWTLVTRELLAIEKEEKVNVPFEFPRRDRTRSTSYGTDRSSTDSSDDEIESGYIVSETDVSDSETDSETDNSHDNQTESDNESDNETDTTTDDSNESEEGKYEVSEPTTDDETLSQKSKKHHRKPKSKKHSKDTESVCASCGEIMKESGFQTIIMKHGVPKVYHFCCIKCMEKFEFPKYQKRTRK